MTANRAEYTVETMARSLGVSRSGFHAWQAREPSARDVADRDLMTLIRKVHTASTESYGAPRVSTPSWPIAVCMSDKSVWKD